MYMYVTADIANLNTANVFGKIVLIFFSLPCRTLIMFVPSWISGNTHHCRSYAFDCRPGPRETSMVLNWTWEAWLMPKGLINIDHLLFVLYYHFSWTFSNVRFSGYIGGLIEIWLKRVSLIEVADSKDVYRQRSLHSSIESIRVVLREDTTFNPICRVRIWSFLQKIV